MRKLWPPTYDRFSVRIWAIFGSAAINSMLWTLLLLGSERVFWWMVPGVMPAFAMGALYGLPEGRFLPAMAAVIVSVGNLGFYYLVVWVLINMFMPSTNWWPEKHKESK